MPRGELPGRSPSQSEYTASNSIHSWLSKVPKESPSFSRRNKRPLASLEPNIMPSSQRDRSPAKKRRMSPVRDDVGEEQVLETPRPAHRQLHNYNAPALSPRSQSSLSVASSSRSRSPEKNITDLLLAPSPILSKQFEEYEAMPPKLETMVRKMRRISRGLGVVPDVCKPGIYVLLEMAMGRILMSADITSRSEKAFRDIDASCYDPASKHPTPYPSAHTIAKIVRLARVCSNAGHYEADWNCRIHSYILDLALDNQTTGTNWVF
jgi:hypothetical protein